MRRCAAYDPTRRTHQLATRCSRARRHRSLVGRAIRVEQQIGIGCGGGGLGRPTLIGAALRRGRAPIGFAASRPRSVCAARASPPCRDGSAERARPWALRLGGCGSVGAAAAGSAGLGADGSSGAAPRLLGAGSSGAAGLAGCFGRGRGRDGDAACRWRAKKREPSAGACGRQDDQSEHPQRPVAPGCRRLCVRRGLGQRRSAAASRRRPASGERARGIVRICGICGICGIRRR